MIKLKSFNEERDLLLSKDIQKESIEYLEELKKIDSYGKKVAQKKVEAEQEIPKIKKEIALLNAEYYKENEPEKLKEIEDKRLMLRLKLDDLEGLTNTNIKAIINQKFLKDLEGYEEKAREEHIRFQGSVRAVRGEYLELQKDIQRRLNELTLIENMHSYNRAINLKEEIERMDYIQDSGWVGSGYDTRGNTNIIFKDGKLYGPDSVSE